jgi:glycerol uptake facilitator-like aquaporin
MTFIFILVIYSTAVSSRAYKSFAPIPIALTVVSLILMG